MIGFRHFALSGACLLTWTAAAGAQDMSRVRTLYVDAAYEEALAAMPATTAGISSPEMEQYRALCLLALGREDDARATIERLVAARPMFKPEGAEVPPRMIALFAGVRAQVLPGVVKTTYAEAKGAYEEKKHDVAAAAFAQVLELIESLPDDARGPLDDLRVLASDFRELAMARAKPSAPAPEPERPVAAPPKPAGPFVPAVAVTEDLPVWTPNDVLSRTTTFEGLLRLQIGEDGRVASAEIVKPSHPAYDVAVLQAAKKWVYRPATRGGQAVPSQKEIRVRLVPR
jgi:TonB family protein